MGLRLSNALLILAAASLAADQPTLTLSPNRALCDELTTIHAAGLAPNERVTIEAQLEDGGGHRWASHREFTADAQGSIEASPQDSVALIWSMMPEDKHVAAYQSPRDLGAQVIDFRLLRKNEALATARLEQLSVAEGVERIPLHEGDLRGVLFVPPEAHKERRPAILVVGGSNGGLPARA